MKQLFLILLACVLLMSNVNAQTQGHDWTFNEHMYPTNMTLVLTITVDGEAITSDDMELGAFCNGVCQGKCFPQYFPYTSTYLYFMTILGEGGQCFEFYLRDDEGVEQEVVTGYSICFEENGTVNNITVPFIHQEAESYTLVTDPAQIVAGRAYLLANGMTEGAKALGYQSEDGRTAVDMDITGRRASMMTALNGLSQGLAYQLAFAVEDNTVLVKDVVNASYIMATAEGQLILADSEAEATTWNYDLFPNGTMNIYTTIDETTMYISFDEESSEFVVGEEAYDLSLFARCAVVDAEVSELVVEDIVEIHVIPSEITLNLTQCTTSSPDVLLLESGAQLVTEVTGVQGTSQFAVEAYTDPEVADGYYTIASPMTAESVMMSPGLLTSDYDLFYFDETNITHEEWRNVKDSVNNGFNAYESGRGYLYANSLSGTPAFVGTFNSSASVSVELTVTDRPRDGLDGFNLIGNPYPHNIYKGAGAAIDDDNLASGYYVLENSGSWLAKTYADPIKPCQGVLVQATSAGSLTINKSIAEATSETAVTDGQKNMGMRGLDISARRISVSIQSGRYRDDAHIFLGDGKNLNKIRNIDADAPKLYIFKGGKPYAIAHLDEQAGQTTMGFKTVKQASYTMTFSFDKSDFETLYLVDHLTGATVNLLCDDSYSFVGSPDDYAARFELRWSEEESNMSSNEDLFAFLDEDGRLVLEGIGEHAMVQLIDMTGRVMTLASHEGYRAVPGVYVVRVIENGMERCQKIVW